MESTKAKIILANLRERIEVGSDGKFRLEGVITQRELEALDFFISNLPGTLDLPTAPAVAPSRPEPAVAGPITVSTVDPAPSQPEPEPPAEESVALDFSTLSLPDADATYRVCLDFGTAMSKASFVHDNEDEGLEYIQVLKLGIPGDQEEIDEVMLVSSVFIDPDGLLWFGQNAVKHAVEGSGSRIDNIKRALSEGNLNVPVDATYNPTSHPLTYKDIVLAYLTFFTWAINYALENDVELPVVARNFKRRFAMPCFPRANARMVEGELKTLLGEAQILSDTFSDEVHQGLPLSRFLLALKQLRAETRDYTFIEGSVTEPLGVAGSLLSWQSNHDSLALVVDIGAGTSDFSLYRLKVTVNDDGSIDKTKTTAGEVDGTARGITEAGNHLDKLLKGFILQKAGVSSSHDKFQNISHALERNIRDHKESLFNSGSVLVPLYNGEAVEVSLTEFLALGEVKAFEESLRKTLVEILESADKEWINWVQANPSHNLTIVLTGGGATLPMVRKLAEGTVTAHGKTIPVAAARSFPEWLRTDYPDLEAPYPRIAVSLGGARRNIIRSMGVLRTTGFGGGSPTLGSFQTKGI